MEKKPLQAKNVVSFGSGKQPAQRVVQPEEVAEAEVLEEVPAREAPEPEAIETRPLNLRQNRFLDEEPQEPDWADEDDAFPDFEKEDDNNALSTIAEVFIPLHDDSTGAIVRKGMVIVSLIVILCCIVAIAMRSAGTAAVLAPDISALTNGAKTLAAVTLSSL